jgi:hypothetical protein
MGSSVAPLQHVTASSLRYVMKRRQWQPEEMSA